MGLTQIWTRSLSKALTVPQHSNAQAEAVEDGPQHTFDACGTFDALATPAPEVARVRPRAPPAARRARGAARGDLARADAPTLSPPRDNGLDSAKHPAAAAKYYSAAGPLSSAMRGDWSGAARDARTVHHCQRRRRLAWRFAVCSAKMEHYKWTPSAASGLRSIR